MPDEQVLEVQRGIWIDERWIRNAGLGTGLQVVVQPGEIRILAVPTEVEQQESPGGWDVLRSLRRDAQPGQLPNAAVEHDRYLYGKGQSGRYLSRRVHGMPLPMAVTLTTKWRYCSGMTSLDSVGWW